LRDSMDAFSLQRFRGKLSISLSNNLSV
jgi:hypothetical protein